MKIRRIGLYLCLALTIAAAGCGSKKSASGRTGSQAPGVNEVLEAGMAQEDGKKEDAGTAAESEADSQDAGTSPESQDAAPAADGRQSGVNENAPQPVPVDEAEVDAAAEEGIDIDLTALPGTMVYSEVYGMMMSPEDYIGKNVKMEGMFSMYHDEAADKYYFACIIADATACCSQGIEFVLTDDYTYPDDYPPEGDNICVAGTFDTYQEGEYTYCTLREARIASGS